MLLDGFGILNCVDNPINNNNLKGHTFFLLVKIHTEENISIRQRNTNVFLRHSLIDET